MIIRVHMKTPDCIFYAAQGVCSNLIHPSEGDKEQAIEDIKNFLGKWFMYDENVTLEFDTELGTAKVLERRP